MKQCLQLEEMQGHAQQGCTRLDTKQRTPRLTAKAEREERAGQEEMLTSRGPGHPLRHLTINEGTAYADI